MIGTFNPFSSDMKSAITISLVSEARGGPFVFWDDLPKACRTARELGFDAVEIFPRGPDQMDAKDVASIVSDAGLRVAAVGTGAGWVVHKLRLTDPDPEIRRRAREFVSRIIDIAGSFEAPAIIGSMQGKAEGSISKDTALQWLVEALAELGAQAESIGTNLLLEPLNRYETNLCNLVENTLPLLDGLPGSIKLLCDLFHMNIEEVDISAALRLAGDRLGHVHFADSNRQAIGFGHTDMRSILHALRDIGYGGYLSAEILPCPTSEAAATQTIASFKKWAAKDRIVC